MAITTCRYRTPGKGISLFHREGQVHAGVTMTAEIVIMNREAVAIAADSAVSLMGRRGDRPQKIFTSGNKIFELSRKHTACIMVYNNGNFMGIPWSTIITFYRQHLGDRTFATLREYGDHFIRFLSVEKEFVPSKAEENYFVTRVYNQFLFIRYLIQQNATVLMRQKGAISEEEIQEIAVQVVTGIYEKLQAAEFSPSMDSTVQEELRTAFAETIDKAIKEVFQNLPIPAEIAQKLGEIALLFIVKSPEGMDPAGDDFSGVVITGFGDRDIFPSIRSFQIEGRIANHLKYREVGSQEISLENGASIVPLAQREMVDIFLSGMDPRFEQALLGSLFRTFHAFHETIIDSIEKLDDAEKTALKEKFSGVSNELVQQLQAQLQNYRLFNANPIVNVVASLPKADLASMAESLVNLTALKRRVSLEAETVGGPADVAVISKSDGFIWVKKKQYFKPLLNMQETLPEVSADVP